MLIGWTANNNVFARWMRHDLETVLDIMQTDGGIYGIEIRENDSSLETNSVYTVMWTLSFFPNCGLTFHNWNASGHDSYWAILVALIRSNRALSTVNCSTKFCRRIYIYLQLIIFDSVCVNIHGIQLEPLDLRRGHISHYVHRVLSFVAWDVQNCGKKQSTLEAL